MTGEGEGIEGIDNGSQNTGVVPHDQVARVFPLDPADVLRLGRVVEEILDLLLTLIQVHVDNGVGVVGDIHVLVRQQYHQLLA